MRSSRTTGSHRMAAVAAVVALGMAACSSPDTTPRASGPGGRPEVVGLRGGAPVTFQAEQDCAGVLEDFQTMAPDVLAQQFAVPDVLENVGGAADGAGAAEGGLSRDVAGSGEDSAASAPMAEQSTTVPASGGASSDTNTQEEGIDEPDVVETDGELVYLVDQDELVVLDGATATVVGRVRLATHGAQIMRSGDRILAISGGGYATMPVEPGVAIDPVSPRPEPMPVEPPSFPVGTVIQLIDVADPAAPAVVQTTELEGNHVSTRVVDGVARIVIASYPQPPVMFDGPVDGGDDPGAAIEERLGETEVEDWLPSFRTMATSSSPAATTTTEGSAVECEDVLVPEVNAGLAETSILRVDFEDGFDPADTTTIVADAGTVYASATTLYVAATRFVSPGIQEDVAAEDWSTAVHAFDLRGDGPASHVGAGEVPGTVLNQYSMSEHDGHLRVATTEGTPWGAQTSESGVRVLRLEGDQLTEVGAVTGLGLTETIQSVRFMGPVGYVVTFRQTDPLYVVDLSDPTDPRAVGELKIPGFSSYLHPVGEGRLLGIGRDATEEGVDLGVLVSLFDVSDPTDPRQLQTWTQRDAYSAAGDDPKAFLWWAPESIAAIPMDRYFEPTPERPNGSLTGITVLDVDDSGITERAVVTAGERYPSRALVVQGRLWSLFDGAVVTSELADPAGGTLHAYR